MASNGLKWPQMATPIYGAWSNVLHYVGNSMPFGMYSLFPLDWADLMGLSEGGNGGTLRSVITLSTIRDAITWGVFRYRTSPARLV